MRRLQCSPIPPAAAAGAAAFAAIIAILASAPAGAGAAGPPPAEEIRPGAEPPVAAGLELWLDAAQLNGLLQKLNLPPARENQPAPVWPDASGHQRHGLQPMRAFQPLYRVENVPGGKPRACLRFDGQDDFFAVSRTGKVFSEATLFLAGAPRSNAGVYRAFLSACRAGSNDYTSGINIDLGRGGGPRFEQLNIEGAGFGGENNMLPRALPFGGLHRITAAIEAAGGSVRVRIDQAEAGKRPRSESSLQFDEIRIGARLYRNDPGPTYESGFFHGDIAEVLLYGRRLTDDEIARVEDYLADKYPGAAQPAGAPPIPPAQMLVPGFTSRELPVQLTNINGLQYIPGGRLLALGYDGRIHALRDADGDGLEDTVEPYWYEPGLRVPIAMVAAPEGLYVTSNGKVSLLRDTNGDGRPDRELVIASGWKPAEVFSGPGVDAMGLALDAAGNLYFGLGCADFTNAYLVRDGKAHYDLNSERGTILKIPPNRERREIVCTGIRFPFALAFNRDGDLFATDQEGETWLPGGNPLDELDHILPGRHYGFPPRHPERLPGVVDDPPAAEFSPQHQSTCGLIFNESGPGKTSFGPASWEGDALVAGFSRGKLWRVPLVKTRHGYAGRPALIASFDMLTLTLALSPQGQLVVACHGGGPDWGNGPGGQGRLVKIFYSQPEAPLPLFAWPAGPLEVRVAYDRPSARKADEAPAAPQIAFGEHVRAGDRFESHRPGYLTVQAQLEAPQGNLPVAAARWSDDRRTLVISTNPHPVRATYAVSLAGADLDYNLNGAEASWRPAGEKAAPAWSGWLPHLDLEVSRQWTAGSAEHDRLRDLIAKPGILTLKSRLAAPAGLEALRFRSPAAFRVNGEAAQPAGAGGDGGRELRLAIERGGDPPVLTVELETGAAPQPPGLTVSCELARDPHPRPLPAAWQLLPWSPERPLPPPAPAGPPPQLAGGDWNRGREIYSGLDARCSACHKLRGEGGTIGPDLSNLQFRDAASVQRDIIDPSAAINPDYIPYTVILKNNQVLTGTVRSEGEEKVILAGSDAQEKTIARRDIRELRPGTVSIMPKGMAETLGPVKLRDLMTFLLQAAPPQAEPPPEAKAPPRTPAELRPVLESATPPPASGGLRAINIVLVAGPKDHGPGEHDYPRWQESWKDLLGKLPGVRISTAWEWPDRGHLELADVLVFYFWNHGWNDDRYRDLDAFLARGGGMVLLHSSVIPDREPEKLAARIGLAWEPNRTKFRHGPLTLKFTAAANHPITRGLDAVDFVDETYWPLVGDPGRIETLATAIEDGKPQPMMWTCASGKGRVFVSILGHYLATFDDPLFRLLAARGIAWAAGEPAARFEGIAREKP